jgi:hypothetical protein
VGAVAVRIVHDVGESAAAAHRFLAEGGHP